MKSKSDLLQYVHDPVGFIDTYITKNEKGLSWSLSRHQRSVLERAFVWDEAGRLRLRLFVWGEMKKSGKSFLAACLTLWWALTNPSTEIIVAANDQEQAQGRVFRTMVALLTHNPVLRQSVTVRVMELLVSNGTLVTAISSEYRSAAGSRHSLYVIDEPWGIVHESAQRLFEELTPPPTEANAWGLLVTTAGWTGESVLLERLYQQGLSGERIDDELELYRAGDLFMFWSHTPRQPWQTEAYYASQRATLRPATFQRLHENRWVSAESSFLTAELWDACVDPAYRPCLPSPAEGEIVAVDLGLKHDLLAVVRLRRRGDRLVLAGHRLWTPSPGQPLNLEETFEAYVRELHAAGLITRIVIDPWQAARSVQTLKAAGLPIEEFPQTQQNTTRMGQALFDVIKGRTLTVYPSDELRQQALNCVAVETPRGVRITKEKASKKIDAIVALSMACVAALDGPAPRPLAFSSGGITISADPQPVASSVPLAPGVLAPLSVQPDLGEQVTAIRNKPLCQRSAQEHRLVDEWFESQRRQLAQLDPLARAALTGGYMPNDGDLETDLRDVGELFRGFRGNYGR
jgi:phage terminase large subunit-like protein